MTYAAATKVSVEKTKAEVEGLVMKRGADNFVNSPCRDKAKIDSNLTAAGTCQIVHANKSEHT